MMRPPCFKLNKQVPMMIKIKINPRPKFNFGVVDDTYASGSEIKQSESMKAEDD